MMGVCCRWCVCVLGQLGVYGYMVGCVSCNRVCVDDTLRESVCYVLHVWPCGVGGGAVTGV